MLLALCFKYTETFTPLFFPKMQFNNPQRKYAEKTAAYRAPSGQHKGTLRNQCTVFSKKFETCSIFCLDTMQHHLARCCKGQSVTNRQSW